MFPVTAPVDLGRVEVNIGALLGIGGEVEVEAASEGGPEGLPAPGQGATLAPA